MSNHCLAVIFEVPMVVNAVRTSVLLNEREFVSVYWTVDIESADFIMTSLPVDSVRVYTH